MANNKLTPKQKAFADEYIINGGNATQAAVKAGYSKKTAEVTGSKLLRNAKVKAYIAEIAKPIEEKRQFELEDAINNLIDILSGKPIESRSMQIDHLKKDKVVKDVTYQYSADPDQRIKALDIYFKVKGAYERKQESEETGNITIVDSWGDEDE
ncbi:terminase small subunit [Enterococcus faecalis]